MVKLLIRLLYVFVFIFIYPKHSYPEYEVIPISSAKQVIGEPQLNNNGFVVWSTNDGTFLYNGTSTVQVTNDGFKPNVNDTGKIVWDNYDDNFNYNSAIFLFNGYTTVQVTDGTTNAFEPYINNSGQIVWHEDRTTYNRTTYNWYYQTYSIYNGLQIEQLTSNAGIYNRRVRITNSGYVVWSESDGNDLEIFLYHGSTKTQITSNSIDDYYPHVTCVPMLIK